MIDFIEQISPLQMIVALVVIAIIAHIALGFVLKQITKHSDSTETQIDDHLINAIAAPLKLLIWYGWFYFSLAELTSEIQALTQILGYISITPVFILTWGILRLISSIENYMLDKEGSVDKDSVRLFTRLIKILFVFAIILVLLSIMAMLYPQF